MNTTQNNIYPGDFIYTYKSLFPALVIKKVQNDYLVSIIEYNGDYILINYENMVPVNLEPLQKLGILAKFDNFFYNQHKHLYQQILIEYFTSIL